VIDFRGAFIQQICKTLPCICTSLLREQLREITARDYKEKINLSINLDITAASFTISFAQFTSFFAV